MKKKHKRDSNISREFRLPANVMHEEAWEDDGPNMKLARAFVVVLILHIVAVAGLAAFNLLDDGDPKIGADTKMPEKPALEPVEPLEMAPVGSGIGQSNGPVVMEGTRPIQVERPMSTARVADEYGLTEQALLELNKHIPLVKGQVLTSDTIHVPQSAQRRHVPESLPVAPVVQTPPAEPSKPAVEATTPARSESTPPKREVASHTPKTTPPQPPKRETASSPPSRPRTKSTPPAKSTTRKPSSSARSHTIAKGETLYRISRKYGISVGALQKANGIEDPAKIQAGQRLTIPR